MPKTAKRIGWTGFTTGASLGMVGVLATEFHYLDKNAAAQRADNSQADSQDQAMIKRGLTPDHITYMHKDIVNIGRPNETTAVQDAVAGGVGLVVATSVMAGFYFKKQIGRFLANAGEIMAGKFSKPAQRAPKP